MHEVSLAVWGVPSTVVVRMPFQVNLGAKCLTAECSLAGHKIAIFNEQGEKMAEGTLADSPLEGTAALYWARITVKAPEKPGLYRWRAGFSGQGEHREGSYDFGFLAGRAPEFAVRVEAVVKDMGVSVQGFTVLLNRYQGVAGHESESVTLAVPRGTYDLVVARDAYQTYDSIIDVEEDMIIRVELAPGAVHSGADVSAVPVEEPPSDNR